MHVILKKKEMPIAAPFLLLTKPSMTLGGDRQQLPQLWMRRSQSFLHTWSHKSSSSSSSSSSSC
jgi:hypothetical protein